MKCPICGHNFSGARCRCGYSNEWKNQATGVASRFYNAGLAHAGAGRLTAAISALNDSLAFDARLVQARNLLGLCYYKIGHVCEAVKHWVISDNISKKDNPAAEYLAAFQKEQRTVDRLSEAVAMYNQALNYLQQDSDDIAIIQLKRALDINPDLLEALNLLALCCLRARDKGRAARYIDQALRLDRDNPAALSYARALGRDESHRAEPPKRREAPPPVAVSRSWVVPVWAQLVGFLLGAACCLAVMLLLVNPAANEAHRREISEAEAKYTSLQSQAERERGAAAEREAELNAQLGAAIAQSADAAARIEREDKARRVQVAYSTLLSGRPQDAVDYLATIPREGLEEPAAGLYRDILAAAYPMLEREYLDAGIASFNAKDYEAARADLDKALEYAEEQADYVYYYLGRVYEALADKTPAMDYYAVVTDDYPDSRWAADAKRRFNNLNR